MKKIILSSLLICIAQVSSAFADQPANTIIHQLAYTVTCRGSSDQGIGALCPGDKNGGEGWGKIVFSDDPSATPHSILLLQNANYNDTDYADLFGALQAVDSIARVDHPHQDPVKSGLFYVSGYFGTNSENGHAVFIMTQANVIPTPQD
jgi:hypothetical protein